MENLLKVTLLKLEDEKEAPTDNGSQDKNKQDQSTDKANDEKDGEEKKDDTEKDKGQGEKEKKDEQEGKEKVGGETEKAANDKNKDSSLDVVMSKKPDRSMDNTCKSRSFVTTAEVNLSMKLTNSYGFMLIL